MLSALKIIKPIIFSFLLVFISICGCKINSEEDRVKDQILEAKKHAESRQYEKAEMELRHAISMSRKIHGANDVIEGLCYLKLIYLLLNMDRPSEAKIAVDHAWMIFNQYGELAASQRLKCIAGEAAIYSYREEYAPAESLLNSIYNSYLISGDSDLHFYYYISSFLASVKRVQGRFNEADSLYKTIIKEISNTNDDGNDEYLILSYLGLSSIAIKQDSLNKSLQILDSLQMKYTELYDEFPRCGSTISFHRSLIYYRTFNTNPLDDFSKSIEYMIKYFGECDYGILHSSQTLYKDFKYYGLYKLSDMYKIKAENIKGALQERREPDEDDLNLMVDWTEHCTE